MIRVHWDLEEAVALFDFYFSHGATLSVSIDDLLELSAMYKKRAKALEITTDEKFRNEAGLRIQLACVHYVVTDGMEGMSNASKPFYQTYDLYLKDPRRFKLISESFWQKYRL